VAQRERDRLDGGPGIILRLARRHEPQLAAPDGDLLHRCEVVGDFDLNIDSGRRSEIRIAVRIGASRSRSTTGESGESDKQ
jgi:hypothetical protein